MKKVFAWLLLLTLVVGMFAGCKQTETTTPTEGVNGAQEAIDYLKGYYTDNGKETPADFTRFGIVRVGGVAYDVVWTVDVGEDLIKIEKNEDGTYTINVNEDAEEATEYKLTATVTDANGNTASYTWTYILPKAIDMVAIVEAAYALEVGDSMPGTQRLRGKVIAIGSIWTEQYQNITVTIEVEGAEDKPIVCYRMKGTADTVELLKNVQVGNIITVTGTIKNYNGTIEFDSGCLMIAWEKGDAVEAPTDPGEILKQAYALAKGESLPYPTTLTGTVTEIDSPYDPGYGNISVVIEVEGYPQYPILCYRLKGTGVDQIAVKDVITVSGVIKNYNGTIEYDSGCQLVSRVSGGGVAEGPSSDPDKIIPDALKLSDGESLPYRATLTGTIYNVEDAYDPEYGSVTVVINVRGYLFKCYRMKGDGADQIRETDTITVSGIVKNYKGTLEFDQGCSLDSWSMGSRSPNYGPLSEGVAYKMYIDQKSAGKVVYFNGKIGTTNMQTTETGSKGVDVYMERTNGKGVRFYFMNGTAKTYIEIEEYTNNSGALRGRAKLTTEPSCYWSYNSYVGAYTVKLATAGKYLLGTYKDYTTISATWQSYVDGMMSSSSAQYIVKFIKSSEVPADEPADTVVQGTPVANPVPGTAYKFGFYQNNLDNKPFLAFTGKMANTFYFGTSNAIADMVDVYIEETTGGYYIYFMNGSTKTYLDIVPRTDKEGAVNVVMQTSGTHSVYTFNTEHKYVYTTVEGTDWYFGTYDQKNTISGSKTSYIEDTSKIGVSQFCAWFHTVEEVEAPTEPEEPSGDTTTMITNPAASTAYKMGMDIGDTILYFNGKTVEGKSYYLDVTKNASEAVDVYLETVTGGYLLYFMDGNTKTYIHSYERTDGEAGKGKGSLELVTTAPTDFFTYDSTANTLIYTADADNSYYIGTYDYQGTIYENASVSNASYITGSNASKVDVSQFPAHFYTVELGEGEPDTSEPGTSGTTATVVEAPVVDTAYKFGYDRFGTVQYFTGNTESADVTYRLETTTDASKAVDVYLETATGGYRLYFMNGDVKTYINMKNFVNNKGYNSGSLELVTTTPADVMTYDENWDTLLYDYQGEETYYLGTYDTKDSIQASSTDYITGDNAGKVGVSQFIAHFYTVEAGGPEESNPGSSDPESSTPEGSEPGTSEPATGKAMIDKVADLTAGTYYMSGYLTAYSSNDYSDAPYHVWDGATYTNSSAKTYLTTVQYSYASGQLTGTGAGEMKLVAVDGKANTYYIMSGDQYLSSTEAAANKLALGDTKAEWVASDCEKGGILLTTSVAGTDVYLGTAAATKNMIRGYSNLTNVAYGMIFFDVNGGSTEPDTSEPETSAPETSEPDSSESSGNSSIATALAGEDGASFTVKGVVTLIDGKNVHIQDATGGINLYLTAEASGIAVGDTVIGTGARATYSGLPQLKNATFEISSGLTLTAKTTTIGALTNADIGTYVKIENVTVVSMSGNYVAISDGTNSINIYKGVIPSEIKATDIITFTGAVSAYNGTLQLRNTVATEITLVEEGPGISTEPIDGTFVKVTDASQLTTGKYVLVVSSGYAPGVVDGTWISAVQPTISGNEVTDAKGGVWTLTVNGSSVRITDANGVAVAPAGGNKNGIKTGTAYDWAWSFASGVFQFAGTGDDTVKLASNTTDGSNGGLNRFRGYKNTTVANNTEDYLIDFTLYKLVEE